MAVCRARCEFMAACGAMSLKKGILATALVVLLVAGCSKVVDGRAVPAV